MNVAYLYENLKATFSPQNRSYGHSGFFCLEEKRGVKSRKKFRKNDRDRPFSGNGIPTLCGVF